MASRRRIALVIINLALGCGTARAGLDPASEATLAKHVLTENELNRLGAAMQDALAHGQATSIDLAGAHSIDSLGARIDAQPGAPALLAAHGFTGRDYVIAVLATLRAEMAAQMGAGTNSPNVAFYRTHQAPIDRVMGLDSGAASTADPGTNLSALNPKKLGECTEVAMGSVSLVPLSMRGTANTPAESRETVAKVLADLVPKVGEQNLKEDFRALSEEIRRQAAAPQFTSTPRFTRALGDLNAWLRTNCSKDAG